MTYEEIKKLINQNDYVTLFGELDKVRSEMPDYLQSAYSKLKTVFMLESYGANYSQQLTVFVGELDQVKVLGKTPQPIKNYDEPSAVEAFMLKAKSIVHPSYQESAKLYELQQRAIEEMSTSNIKEHYPYIIFDRIISAKELKSQEVNELKGFVSSLDANYYEKCIVVSSLTLSLIKQLDLVRLGLLIDFVQEYEDQVWQRALIGLILSLRNRSQKLEGQLRRKVEVLKDAPHIQKALVAIDQAYHKFQRDLQEQSSITDLLSIFAKMRKRDFFKQAQHWFLPFYPENKVAEASIIASQHDVGAKKMMNLLYKNIAIGNSDKYAICFYLDELSEIQLLGSDEEGNKREGLLKVLEAQNQRLIKLISTATISEDFVDIALYEQYLMDLHQFFRYYPKDQYDINILKAQQLYQTGLLELIAKDTAQMRIRAHKYLASEKYQAAENEYRALLKVLPNDVESWGNLGVACYKLKQYQEAILAYQKAIEIKNNDVNLWLYLGRAYVGNEQLNKALTVYQKAVEINPKKAEAWDNLARLQYAQGNITLAIASFEQVVSLEPQRIGLWRSLGQLYLGTQQLPKALDAFAKAIELQPNDMEVWYQLAICLTELEQYSEALEAFQIVKSQQPEMQEVWINMGYVYLVMGNISEAKAHLEKAQEISAKPNDAILVNLGHIALIENKPKEAIILYQQALNYANPNVFFSGIESDFPHLQKQGISREKFDEIVAMLKQQRAQDEPPA